jgi:predicted Zn-dependent peptidase
VPGERHLPTRVPVLERALEFLCELIFSPAGNGAFVEEYVETEKENMRKFISSLVENRASYAMRRLHKLMCEGEPFERYEYGDLEELERTRPKELFKFYRSMRRRAPLDIYILGNIEPDRAVRSAGRVFTKPRAGRRARYRLLAPVVKSAHRKPRFHREHTEVAQGHLVMGYRANVAFQSRDSHALALASAVLGGFAHSKLFRIVREKMSLAYSVGTRMIRSKGVMVAYAGVEPGGEAKVQKLIEQQVARLQAGRISDFELDSTKRSILDDLAAITDSPAKEIDFDFVHLLHGEQTTPQEIARKIDALTRDEIAAAARKLKLDTVFVLTKQA